MNSTTEIAARLRSRGINPTRPRVEIAQTLFSCMAHLSAEDVYKKVNADAQRVSKATVYNTLGLFVEKGLVREVIADPSRVVYDSNTLPHYHFYNVESGAISDIRSDDLRVSGMPALPEGVQLEGIDVIVRLRPISR